MLTVQQTAVQQPYSLSALICDCLERLYRPKAMTDTEWQHYLDFLQGRGLNVQQLETEFLATTHINQAKIAEGIARQLRA